MGDNIGGGAPGDGTILLKALIDAGVKAAFVSLHDPAAVEAAEKAGKGKSVSLSMGGKGPKEAGAPIATKAKVVGLFDGKFSESEARHGGRTEYSMGRTAVVELPGGQTVMLTTDRVAPFSLGQLTSCELDPKKFKAIVAKGVHAPVAAYRSVCPTMIRVNTPGIATADLTKLDYQHRRKPLFPLEAI
jgi:microcystin degradation protein MlrC